MTVRGVWGSMSLCEENEEGNFGLILDDSMKAVEAPFRKDQGPEMALDIMEICGLGGTVAAAELRKEVDKAVAKREEDQEIIRWLKETKGETGFVITKKDRADFAKQKKFWGRGEGC